ncbi:DUF4190 domain-containing protein [Curtobacterium sp. WHRI 8282]|uniref:DUF4190 domain-containing protein n=1 Tax=Curtobacterium sp. WHRI 8282 TaxID=3162559 RepID=UPI0032EED52A
MTINQQTRPYSTLSIVGFVLAFVVPVAGIVVSALGRNDARRSNRRGFALATWGLWIGIIFTALIAFSFVSALLDPVLS